MKVIMPTPCSIPGCRTNRSRTEKILSVFNFPKDPTRRYQWEWAVRLLYDSTFTYKDGYKICIRHFEDELIETEHRAVRDDGSVLTIPRKSLTLTDTAVPTQFDFLPDPHPGIRGRRRHANLISNLHTLRDELESKLKEDMTRWSLAFHEQLPALSIFKVGISESYEPAIRCSVTFNSELCVKVVHSKISSFEIELILGNQLVCNDWYKLRKLIRLLDSDNPPPNKRKREESEDEGDETALIVQVTDDGRIQIEEEPIANWNQTRKKYCC